MFIPSPVRLGTLLMEVPGTPIEASYFEFELKDSADPTQLAFQHHIGQEESISKHSSRLEC